MRKGVVLAALVLTACGGARAERVELSGRQDSRAYRLGGFESVSLEGPDRVIVRVGGAAGVSAAGDSAVLDQLEVRVERGALKIGRKRNGWTSVNGDRERAVITVTVPRLAAAAVAGSGEMTVDRVAGGSFAAAVSGSGDLRVDEVRGDALSAAVAGSGDLTVARAAVRRAELSMAGSGDLRVAGTAGTVAASIAGSGDIDASGLQGATGQVSIAGSGNAAIRAQDAAQVSIVGSGNALVHGTANCQVSKLGSGGARCGLG